MRTTPDRFEQDLKKILMTYTNDVVEGIETEIKDTAEFSAEQLRNIRQPDASEGGSAHPMNRRQWTKYSKSWTVTERKGTNFYRAVVHNRKHYRLTHLLELGHMTRNGTKTRAFRHIEPIELYAVDRIETNIPKIIKKGGQ